MRYLGVFGALLRPAMVGPAMVAAVLTIVFLAAPLGVAPALASPKRYANAQQITPQEAVKRAIESNLGYRAARLAAVLSEANERAAEGSFDARLVGGIDLGGAVQRMSAQTLDLPLLTTFDVGGSVGVEKRFVTGTALNARLRTLFQFDTDGELDGSVTTGALALTVNQPLLRGVSTLSNRLAITNARFAREAADAQLQRQAELLAAQVLKAYWDLHDALARVRIQRVALAQARTTVTETEALIQGQKLAAAELVVARHQVAIQERAVLLAEQAVENTRDSLGRLMGAVEPRSLQTPPYVTRPPAAFSGLPGKLEDLQKQAYQQRGDYQALCIDAKSQDVRVEAFRHRLLPRLDLVGNMSIGPRRSLIGRTATEPSTTGWLNWAVGLSFEIPLGNREARAELELADLRARQVIVGIREKEQVISEELKVAWRGVQAGQALVTLTTAALQVAETKLENELERYRAGKSSGQILLIVQTDLIQERISLQQAMATLQKALVDLHTAAGDLLKTVL